MWFGVLGPLLVRHEDVTVDVPAARHRALLAALLLRAGTVIPADTLADMVWDGAPPPGAEVTLRSHVSRLRQVLGPDVAARVVTRYRGYLVEAGEEEVDLLRFRGLCRKGAAAARSGEWAHAWESLDEALGLWRGTPLADVPGELLHHAELPGLEEHRLQALEWHAEAGLRLGRHDELAAELQPLTTAHPLRERFHAQLMLAQYRCGRPAEALASYQSARQALVEALGTDPGTELRDLHQRILTADPALDLPRHPESASSPGDNGPVMSIPSAGPGNSSPAGPGPSSGPPRRKGAGRLWSRRPRVIWATLSVVVLAVAALIISAVFAPAPAPSPPVSLAPGAVAAIHWHCGPVRPAALADGNPVSQTMRACIALAGHGSLDLEGILTGPVNAWGEKVVLALKHPRQKGSYERLFSPVCTARTCIYAVQVTPPPGSWWAVPGWARSGGAIQSWSQQSPSRTTS